MIASHFTRTLLTGLAVVLPLLAVGCGGDDGPTFDAVDTADIGTDQLCEATNAAIDSVFLSYEITLNPELTKDLVAHMPRHIQQRLDHAAETDDSDFYLEWATQADVVTTAKCGVPVYRTLAHLEGGCFPPDGGLDAITCRDPRATGYDDFESLADLWPNFDGWDYEV